MEFKVGDRVKIKKNDIVGCIYEMTILKNGKFSLDTEYYTMGYIYSVTSENRVYVNLKEEDLELIEKFKEPTSIEQLEQRIEKLEKCVMGEQNSLEKCENEPIYERNERFAKILKKELEKKPNLEINLGKPNIDDKEFKQMLKNKPIVLNTNDPLEMIWNSNEEETKPSLLTEDERVILRNLDKKWKWIARDEGGVLFVYEEKPERRDEDWMNESATFRMFNIFSINLFQFINWEDDEPYNIEELLKGECGNE